MAIGEGLGGATTGMSLRRRVGGAGHGSAVARHDAASVVRPWAAAVLLPSLWRRRLLRARKACPLYTTDAADDPTRGYADKT